MTNNRLWTLTWLFKLFKDRKFPLFLLLLLSIIYAAGVVVIGHQVSISGFQTLEEIGLGAIVVIAVRMLSIVVRDVLGNKLILQAQQHIAERIINTRLFLQSGNSPAELLRRFATNFTVFAESMVHGALNLVSNFLLICVFTIYIIKKFPSSVLDIFLLLLLGVIASLSLQRVLKSLSRHQEANEESIFREQKNLIEGAEYLLLSGRNSEWIKRFNEVLKKWEWIENKTHLLQHSAGSVSWGLKYLFVILIISPFVMGQSLEPGAAYWLYVMLGTITQLYWSIYQVGHVRVHMDKAKDLIAGKGPEEKRVLHNQLSIEAIDLSVYFGPRQTVNGVTQNSIKWQVGDRVWISGMSGSGKTTLLRTIVGLHHNFTGLLKVPGEAFKVGYLSQDPFFFDGDTLGRNLGVEKIEDAAKKHITALGLNKLFDAFNYDFLTKIGKESFNVSQGQKTRLALLRVLLQNPDIIVLDEPTANLDEESTKNILRYLNRLSADKLIVVSEHSPQVNEYFRPNLKIQL